MRRMCCSRDEAQDRPWSGPSVQLREGVRLIAPRDEVAGGTWVMMNEHGVAGTLLNRTLPDLTSATPTRSRGSVLLDLASASSVADVKTKLEALDFSGMGPFRLVLHDSTTLLVAAWHASLGLSLSLEPLKAKVARVWCSSGLGDHLVDAPRSALFEELVLAAALEDRPAAQSTFHRTFWPDRSHLSPSMSRSAAATTSLTLVEPDSGTMTLWNDRPSFASDPIRRTL